MKSKIASLYSYKVSVAIKNNGNEARVEYNKELERTIKAGLAAGVMRKTLENAVKRFKEMDQVETVIEITGPGNSKILVRTLGVSKTGFFKTSLGRVGEDKSSEALSFPLEF